MPEELVRRLKEGAGMNGRSLNEEALARRNGAQTVRTLRRLHKRLAGVPPLTEAFLNRAKNAGRR